MNLYDALAEGGDAWAIYREKRDRERAIAARRKPPMPSNPGSGYCAWCTLPIVYPAEHKRAGERNTRRGWHQECVGWFKVASWQDAAWYAVERRDGGRCALCPAGTPPCPDVFVRWHRWSRDEIQTDVGRKWFAKLKPTPADDLMYGSCFCSTVQPVYRSTWHADHIVPLWSLAGATLDQRGCFWSLPNLQTLCDLHHAEKTRREAAARVIWRRQQETTP